jgi:hypothetical protein
MLNREIIGRPIYCENDMRNTSLKCGTIQGFLMSQHVVRTGTMRVFTVIYTLLYFSILWRTLKQSCVLLRRWLHPFLIQVTVKRH